MQRNVKLKLSVGVFPTDNRHEVPCFHEQEAKRIANDDWHEVPCFHEQEAKRIANDDWHEVPLKKKLLTWQERFIIIRLVWTRGARICP